VRRVYFVVALLLCAATSAQAQNLRPRPFEIADNSLLVEEAFNQEGGIFQNIFLFRAPRSGAEWSVEFTQEWPLGGQRHQLSYTVPFSFGAGSFDDVLINYRLQARQEDAAGPAISPRLSAILPTGSESPLRWGAQLNLPVSKQFGDLYLHANAGATIEGVNHPAGETLTLFSPQLAGSVIWRTLPMVHLLIESVAGFPQTPAALCCERERTTTWLLSPGLRAARNLGTQQLVLGAALPITLTGPEDDASFLVYFSYELPFRKTP
jgi:hypothetical protein